MGRPHARRDQLLTTMLDDEVVVYDPAHRQAHSLNTVAVAIWNHADGTRSIDELQRLASEATGLRISADAVVVALRRLERAHLLEASWDGEPMTRRQVLSKAGRFGVAAAMVTPLIASTMVPAAAAATSVCIGPTPGTTLGASCSASNPNCLCSQTFGSGLQCVDTSPAAIVGSCSAANTVCPPLSVCVEIDGLTTGDCRKLCTFSCTC